MADKKKYVAMELQNSVMIKSLLPLVPIIYCLCSTSLTALEMVESPVPDAEVSRAQFTRGISNREPIDNVVKIDNSITSLYYFSELRHLEGRKISHRWEYNGQVISEVSFMVEGPRWRVFSKKTLEPSMLGKWTVLVSDQSGWPIHASIFEYTTNE